MNPAARVRAPASQPDLSAGGLPRPGTPGTYLHKAHWISQTSKYLRILFNVLFTLLSTILYICLLALVIPYVWDYVWISSGRNAREVFCPYAISEWIPFCRSPGPFADTASKIDQGFNAMVELSELGLEFPQSDQQIWLDGYRSSVAIAGVLRRKTFTEYQDSALNDAFMRVSKASKNITRYASEFQEYLKHPVRVALRMNRIYLQSSQRSHDSRVPSLEISFWEKLRLYLQGDVSSASLINYITRLSELDQALGEVFKVGEDLRHDVENLEVSTKSALAEGTRWAWGEKKRLPMSHFRALFKQFNYSGKLRSTIRQRDIDAINKMHEALLPLKGRYERHDSHAPAKQMVEQDIKRVSTIRRKISAMLSCLRDGEYEMSYEEKLTPNQWTYKVNRTFKALQKAAESAERKAMQEVSIEVGDEDLASWLKAKEDP